MSARACALGLALALGGVAATAAAGPTPRQRAKADALFRKGKQLMADKSYAGACDAFEQSFDIDPEIGAELNTAHCYQEWGKLAHALADYRKAEAMAKSARDDRLPKIAELVDHLDRQVPRLTIKAPAGSDPSHADVTLDGAAVPDAQLGVAQLVDPGPHVIAYTGASGKVSRTVPVERGASSEVVLDLPHAEGNASGHEASMPPAPPEPPAPPGRTQRIAAIATGAAGVAAMGIASGLAIAAKGRYDAALDDDCMGMVHACDPAGIDATHAARHEANIASVVFGLGAAAVAGGVVLWVLAPHAHAAASEHAFYVVPTVTSEGAGVALGGRL